MKAVILRQGLADYSGDNYLGSLEKGHFSKLASFAQGLAWKVYIGGGRKRIGRNLNLPPEFYDTLNLKTNVYQVESKLGYQVKWRKQQTFYHEISAGFLENDELLTNELYRLGGLHSIRGFNEKFIFANRFVLSRLEVRLFFEPESYLFLAYDQLWYQNGGFSDHPFGIGLGFSIATSSGQFSFALASGKSANQSLNLSGLKVHFGYTSRF